MGQREDDYLRGFLGFKVQVETISAATSHLCCTFNLYILICKTQWALAFKWTAAVKASSDQNSFELSCCSWRLWSDCDVWSSSLIFDYMIDTGWCGEMISERNKNWSNCNDDHHEECFESWSTLMIKKHHLISTKQHALSSFYQSL